MEQIWNSILYDGNTQWVMVSTFLLGVASGALGSFALLRKQSLIGDALAHSALPGICLAFLIIGEKDFIWLVGGAAITGLISAYLIQAIVSTSRIKEDTAIGLVLSVFFGLGIVLLTKVAQLPTGNQSGLNNFIFGQAASLVGTDVKIMGITAAIVVILIVIFFKEFKISTFDAAFAQGVGFPVKGLHFLFLFLLVVTVVVGIQAVGVVLMAALLITPAVTARYWTDSLMKMTLLASMFGGISGVVGTLISTLGLGLSTGPFIVLSATFFFLVSMLFSPHRGLLAKWSKRLKNDEFIHYKWILKTLLQDSTQQWSVEKLMNRGQLRSSQFNRASNRALKEGLIEMSSASVVLTKKGEDVAERYKLVDQLIELNEMYPSQFAHYNLEWLEATTELASEDYQEVQRKLSTAYREYPFLTTPRVN